MAATIQPDTILRDLTELWVSLGKPSNGEASPGVLRACAMTLVVIADATEDAAEVGETLAALMREHPSRAIVVRVHSSPDSQLDARVFAQCWMPFGGRRQICCEQIEISTSIATLAEVPAVILPLVVPDLPVILWHRVPRRLPTAAFEEFSRIATKTILDSAVFPAPRAVLREMAKAVASGQLLADLAWTRLTGWRESIAQVFENPVYRAYLPAINRVEIVYSGDEIPASAFYMAAWLQLGLEKVGAQPQRWFRQAGNPAPDDLLQVEVSSPDFNVSLGSGQLRVNELVSPISLGKPTYYHLLREELSIPGRDVTFDSSLALAARIAEEA